MTPDDAEPLELLDLVSERKPESAGLALSLGGDGTMLRTVKMLGGVRCPIIGVNVGLLGYLTEVEPPALTRHSSDASPVGSWRMADRRAHDARRRLCIGVASTRSIGRALNEARRSRSTKPVTPFGCWFGSTARRSRRTPPTA